MMWQISFLQGDLGGPLECFDASGKVYLKGITSDSKVATCNRAPRTFTNVPSFYTWIQDAIVALESNLITTNLLKVQHMYCIIIIE